MMNSSGYRSAGARFPGGNSANGGGADNNGDGVRQSHGSNMVEGAIQNAQQEWIMWDGMVDGWCTLIGLYSQRLIKPSTGARLNQEESRLERDTRSLLRHDDQFKPRMRVAQQRRWLGYSFKKHAMNEAINRQNMLYCKLTGKPCLW